ncbi:hypothetical protein BDR04DRAFT_1107331 [Suillus decipiens]|nr:hypothetical protein BDR04DRAFT_1107331 [Suillus decipiens]
MLCCCIMLLRVHVCLIFVVLFSCYGDLCLSLNTTIRYNSRRSWITLEKTVSDIDRISHS